MKDFFAIRLGAKSLRGTRTTVPHYKCRRFARKLAELGISVASASRVCISSHSFDSYGCGRCLSIYTL